MISLLHASNMQMCFATPLPTCRVGRFAISGMLFKCGYEPATGCNTNPTLHLLSPCASWIAAGERSVVHTSYTLKKRH